MDYENISHKLFIVALFFTPISAYISIPFLVFSFISLIIINRNFRFNNLDKLQIMLLISLVITSIFAVDRAQSFYAGSAFIPYIIAYFLSKKLFKKRERLKSFSKTLAVLTILVSLIGIFQFFTDYSLIINNIPVIVPSGNNGRITSICYNTLILASFLAFSIPILIASGIYSDKNRIFYLSASAAGIIAFFMTRSRGPTIALIAAVTILMILNRKKLAAFLIPAIMILVVILIEPLRERFFYTLRCANDFSRIISFNAGIRMMVDNKSMITGIGIHNFSLLFRKYCLPGFIENVNYIHNMYLNFFIEAGAIGILILLAISGFTASYLRNTFRRLRKLDKPEKWIFAGLFSSFVGMLVHNLVDNTIYVLGLGILFWITMGIASSFKEEFPGHSSDTNSESS